MKVLILPVLPFLPAVHAWSYTQYLSPTRSSSWATVYPTGPVSVSSTNITVDTSHRIGFARDGRLTIAVTVTRNYLAAGATNICTSAIFDTQNTCLTPRGVSSAAPTIVTVAAAPFIVTNGPSCTQTSFTYTTSSLGALYVPVPAVDPYPGLLAQAAEPAHAALATTYVSTISTNLGGQPVTTTRCDVYLRPEALADGPIKFTGEFPYTKLTTECVDPRRYLCSSVQTTSATCGTDWVGAYAVVTTPPGQPSRTNSSPAPTTSSGEGLGRSRSGVVLIVFVLATVMAVLS